MVDLGIPGLEDAEPLGSGGFGTVYRARQPRLSRDVAVKVLPRTTGDETAELRFQREAAALGVLARHPNIVTVYDSGLTDTGQPYLIMELVGRGSLADEIAASGPMSWGRCLELGVRLAGALGSAHAAGILHRDIKPANVLVSDFGEPMLADFGIARVEGAGQTSSATITGSAAHLAPELLHGDPPSVASDLYALGSTLFEALAGTAAFVRSTDQTIAAAYQRILTAPVPDLRPQGVPDAVCTLLERLLDKDPSTRPPTAEDVGEALRSLQREAGLDVTPLLVATEVADAARSAAQAEEAGAALPAVTDATATGHGATAAAPVPVRRRAFDTGTEAEGPQPRLADEPPAKGRRLGMAAVAAASVIAVGGAVLAAGGAGDGEGDEPAGATSSEAREPDASPTPTPAGGATTGAGFLSAATGLPCTVVADLDAGDDGDGSVASPFGTLDDLIGAVGPGETGCIRATVFDEPVVIGTEASGLQGQVVTLSGVAGEDVVVARGMTVVEGVEYVQLSGFRFEGDGEVPPLTIEGRQASIHYNTFHGTGAACLVVDSGDFAASGADAAAVQHFVNWNVFDDCGAAGGAAAVEVRADSAAALNNDIFRAADDGFVAVRMGGPGQVYLGGSIFHGVDRALDVLAGTEELRVLATLTTSVIVDGSGPYVSWGWDRDQSSAPGILSVSGICVWPGDRASGGSGESSWVTIDPEVVEEPVFADPAVFDYRYETGSGCQGYGVPRTMLDLWQPWP